MSYAEHGPRIFLMGRQNHNTNLIYGDYVLPKKRLEGRLKLYDSCTDIRAWSPNILESTRYFRELNEHSPTPSKVVPFDIVMKSMIGLTAQAQNELRIVQRELQKYKSLKLTAEQRNYLKSFEQTTVGNREMKEMKIESIIRPLSQEVYFNMKRLVPLEHSDTYLSIYFHPDKRFQRDKKIHRSLLTDARLVRKNLNTNTLTEDNTYVISRVTSCDMLTGVNDTVKEHNELVNACSEYIDASAQVTREMQEVAVQTDEYKSNYHEMLNADSSSSQYCESSETGSISDSELRINLNPELCDKSHKGVIIQKDSEIIVLKNELGMKEDELEELRELNKHLQTLLKEKDENENNLWHNIKSLQEKLKVMSNNRNGEVEDLNAKFSASECLVDKLKDELARTCKKYHLQSQKIQQFKGQIEQAKLLSIENESLTKKMEDLSREAESCDIALEQVKNVQRERDILQKQYYEQSCMLVDRENEIKRLLTQIEQMSVTAETREVKMNDVVANLSNEIQAKNDKLSQCETQLVCMEREIGDLNNMLRSSLNNLDECKIAYENICQYKREHDTYLDIQSLVSSLKAFMARLEECKLERYNSLLESDNWKIKQDCMVSYSQEYSSEITSTDFDTGHGSIQSAAGNSYTSSSYDDCSSSKELVNVQIQSDDAEIITMSSQEDSQESEKMELNEVISYERIDCALAMHIKYSIDKIYEMSTILQGAGDQHVQIVKELTKQQHELQKRDHQIVELKRQVEEHVSRRGEGDCVIQEQFRRKLLEKEKDMKSVINKKDSNIATLQEHLDQLENEISIYRAKCDTLEIENIDLINKKDHLSKKNNTQSKELVIQTDRIRSLIEQVNNLEQNVGILKEETANIEDMREKLKNLQIRNNDLTHRFIQTNEIISKNVEIITDLRSTNEQSKLGLTHKSLDYDAMLTQKYDDVVKLRDENQSLYHQLRDTEIKLARSNDTISLLRKESNNIIAITALQANLSGLDQDREKLAVKADNLRTAIASCQTSTTHIESKLQILSHKNETLKADIETVRSTNDQLLHAQRENDLKWTLRDTLYTLTGTIYEKIVSLRREIKESDNNEVENASKQSQNDEIISANGDTTKKHQIKVYVDKSCQEDEQFYAYQRKCVKLEDSIVQEVDRNVDNFATKSEFFEKQNEENFKNLLNDVKLKDGKMNFPGCITYLLQEKNNLENKLQRQTDEYWEKLMLLQKKYNSSLNEFRKRHNENVERLQARFEDIMKNEKGPLDVKSWLQSLNLKELLELHNRINILSSNAIMNGEPGITHAAEGQNHHSCRKNFEQHRSYNKYTLQKENMPLDKRTGKESSTLEIFTENKMEEIAITELSPDDLKHKEKYRFPVDGDEMKHRLESMTSKSRIERTLDWQRERFIYQCSIHHISNNVR